MQVKRLVLASKNPGKLREMQALLRDSGIDVIGLDPNSPDIEETGSTFEENARLKARAACSDTGLPALGEDSGLAVDALEGEPGIHSARWVPGTDADRVAALLRRMSDIPDGQRTARYVSCIALVSPLGLEHTVCGELEGAIGHEPRGTNGFGYDPIFVLPSGLTTAEIPLAEKNRISHRANAFKQAMPLLQGLLGGAEA